MTAALLDRGGVVRPSSGAVSRVGRRTRIGAPWLVVPGVVFLGLFFLWPLGEMIGQSLTTPSAGVGNYRTVIDTASLRHSITITVELSLIGTAITAVLGYVYAYTVVKAGPRWGRVLLGLVLVPAAMNILARTFSLEVILQDKGIVNQVLADIGVISSPLPLIRTPFAIVVGMVSMLLPFMVFPLYTTMRKIDDDLTLAGMSLGATPRAAFRTIFFPLSLPGLLAGSLIVFVNALGYYIVPQLLGNNGSDRFLGQYTAQYVGLGQWGYGSAIGITLLLITVVVLLAASRLVKVSKVFGSMVGGEEA